MLTRIKYPLQGSHSSFHRARSVNSSHASAVGGLALFIISVATDVHLLLISNSLKMFNKVDFKILRSGVLVCIMPFLFFLMSQYLTIPTDNDKHLLAHRETLSAKD